MEKFKNIIILAGGKSTRFWPLGDKSLFTFLGKTIIEHQIQRFLPYAEKLFVVTNEVNRSEIQKTIQKLNVNNIQITTQTGEGQGSGLLSCKGLVTGEALVLNNDDFFEYKDLLETVLSNKDKYHLIMTAKQVVNYLPGGYLKVENDLVREIIEKPGADNMPSHLFRLVVDYYMDFELLLKEIKEAKSEHDDYYEKAINGYINAYISGINKYLDVKNKRGNTYLPYHGYYQTLKFPWQALTMMNYFLSGLKNDEIRLGKAVKIAKTAKIVGPTYIGDNTVIGDFALVRASHIGNNCLIGGYSEVVRSYLGDGIMLHRNYVGDSVLDKNVFMGADAVLANFRFDGKSIRSVVSDSVIDTHMTKLGAMIGADSKIGVNTSILPGVKIGKHTVIGPGETIDTNIEDNKFVFRGKIKENKV